MQLSKKLLFVPIFIVSSIFFLTQQSLSISKNWLFENRQEAIAQAQPAINIGISSPRNGSLIHCDSITGKPPKRRCFFSVRGTASNLPANSYISLMLQVPGTDQWWRGGNSIRPTSSRWTISMASVDLDKPFTEIEGVIIVTTSPLHNTTSPYTGLPNNATFHTDSYLWRIPGH